ncbi:MAG: hypothetical protein HY072_01480 [Deltaproteobacteria bacterium]|nr:hypothetical protein [Deltaproteobacteria bacterium]
MNIKSKFLVFLFVILLGVVSCDNNEQLSSVGNNIQSSPISTPSPIQSVECQSHEQGVKLTNDRGYIFGDSVDRTTGGGAVIHMKYPNDGSGSVTLKPEDILEITPRRCITPKKTPTENELNIAATKICTTGGIFGPQTRSAGCDYGWGFISDPSYIGSVLIICSVNESNPYTKKTLFYKTPILAGTFGYAPNGASMFTFLDGSPNDDFLLTLRNRINFTNISYGAAGFSRGGKDFKLEKILPVNNAPFCNGTNSIPTSTLPKREVIFFEWGKSPLAATESGPAIITGWVREHDPAAPNSPIDKLVTLTSFPIIFSPEELNALYQDRIYLNLIRERLNR